MRRAAIELFAAQGFDQTTAAEIAARAGVTERTFFRHFPDKREVLFDGQEILGSALADAIASAPVSMSPIATLHQAFSDVAALFEANRPYSEPRQRIIAANPALQERESAKHVALVRLVTECLQKRGVEKLRADLVAQTGMAVLGHALTAWLADPSQGLSATIDTAFDELRILTSSD